eukprot:CAMPEP_0177433092 /NCGR_PEP_ID=MMETSP0368-20130122/77026_1 /TAXON_ID=447022 ORGANISM="Scrippsiella hangoei-like, Strain SHHI-4" /NCGR_SAMPLE_ID=MMETSP0368 /ASSEMBLY_ACC=CAM_ASM_000363 /LENGTH=246 /DNA_ID=CAMNT_0018903771 /DNA_START=24 /DNA_END=761 /DNA_ORIENTATION=-
MGTTVYREAFQPSASENTGSLQSLELDAKGCFTRAALQLKLGSPGKPARAVIGLTPRTAPRAPDGASVAAALTPGRTPRSFPGGGERMLLASGGAAVLNAALCTPRSAVETACTQALLQKSPGRSLAGRSAASSTLQEELCRQWEVVSSLGGAPVAKSAISAYSRGGHGAAAPELPVLPEEADGLRRGPDRGRRSANVAAFSTGTVVGGPQLRPVAPAEAAAALAASHRGAQLRRRGLLCAALVGE